MLSREECKRAYKTVEDVFYVTFCPDEAEKENIQCPSFDDFVKSMDLLEKLVDEHLIEEHFDNPPLEWEEIKECNVVYDKEEKKYRLIEDFLENGKRIVFTNTIDSFITENYEPNRFFRKEVRE